MFSVSEKRPFEVKPPPTLKPYEGGEKSEVTLGRRKSLGPVPLKRCCQDLKGTSWEIIPTSCLRQSRILAKDPLEEVEVKNPQAPNKDFGSNNVS